MTGVLLAFGILVVLGACAPRPEPSGSSTPGATPSVHPSPSPRAQLKVDLTGEIHCDQFPYACGAYLSVLPPDTVVDGDWRPAATDPWWLPHRTGASDAGPFDPTPAVAVPALAPGRYRLVMSMLGRSDIVSFAPDGSIATDLLSRCSADVEVTPETREVPVRVEFTPDPTSFGGTCSITVG